MATLLWVHTVEGDNVQQISFKDREPDGRDKYARTKCPSPHGRPAPNLLELSVHDMVKAIRTHATLIKLGVADMVAVVRAFFFNGMRIAPEDFHRARVAWNAMPSQFQYRALLGGWGVPRTFLLGQRRVEAGNMFSKSYVR